MERGVRWLVELGEHMQPPIICVFQLFCGKFQFKVELFLSKFIKEGVRAHRWIDQGRVQ